MRIMVTRGNLISVKIFPGEATEGEGGKGEGTEGQLLFLAPPIFLLLARYVPNVAKRSI